MAKTTNTKHIRVGTDYFLIDTVPKIDGTLKIILLPWNRSTIVEDYSKDYLAEIPKYKAFCSIPSHNNYKQVVNECYNKYHQLTHESTKGYFPNTENFLRHIFNEQYELALDYLGILWHYPSQILPILCLVSTERNTGKTTLLNWLKEVFQNNMTINKNEDFRSQFNSDWADKLIVGIDEVLLDKKEDSELLKSLSTARHFKSEAKGKDKREIDFYGKFILCSNNEDNFVKIDNEEIRYWVVKAQSLKSDNPMLLEKLKQEIPHFLHFLNSRPIQSDKNTRMWFTKEQIWTPALEALKKGNKSFIEKQLLETINDQLETFDLKEIKYSIGDLVTLLNQNNLRVSGIQITHLLKKKWSMDSKNTSYKKYTLAFNPIDKNPTISYHNDKGRVFTFSKDSLLNLQSKY